MLLLHELTMGSPSSWMGSGLMLFLHAIQMKLSGLSIVLRFWTNVALMSDWPKGTSSMKKCTFPFFWAIIKTCFIKWLMLSGTSGTNQGTNCQWPHYGILIEASISIQHGPKISVPSGTSISGTIVSGLQLAMPLYRNK